MPADGFKRSKAAQPQFQTNSKCFVSRKVSLFLDCVSNLECVYLLRINLNMSLSKYIHSVLFTRMQVAS